VAAGFLLAAHDDGAVSRLVPAQSLGGDGLSLCQQPALAPDFIGQSPFHGPERVEVLYLDDGGAAARTAQRNIGIAAQAALLHLAVRNAGVFHNKPEVLQKLPGLGGSSEAGLGDDL